MNSNEAFDRIFRRKFNERQPAFQEAHWEAMQELIAADERRRRRGFFWAAIAGVLLTAGGAAWWAAGEADAGSTLRGGPEMAEEQPPSNTTKVEPGPTPSRATTAANINDPGSVPTEIEEIKEAVRADRPIENASSRTRPEGTVVERSTAADASVVTVEEPVQGSAEPQPIAVASAVTAAVDGRNGTTAEVEPETSGAAAPVLPIAPGLPIPTEVEQVVEANAAVNKETGHVEEPVGHDVVEELPAMAVEATATPSNPAGADSTELALRPNVASADSAAPSEPLMEAGASPSGPWELSLLGGIGASINTYDGPLSEFGESNGPRSNVFGFEAMRMGPRFGWGIGLYYTCFGERMTTVDRFQDYSELRTNYFLTPVQVTLPAVVGSFVQNGQTFYITQPIDTTLFVLGSELDTVTTTQRTLEARTWTNTLCYVELPLMGDVHTRFNKWELGVRGGPSIGLLTSARGEVPNNEQNGYDDLADRNLRSVQLGLDLRAYLRYRFLPNWSIGIEPGYRTRFLNVFAEDGADRRISSYGASLSINFRLPERPAK
ncbi:MAG: hypothetical protein KDB88_09080 [Flavobacteriales bacterium]|nr:hypothetical protein [Flavobacteriales bacterium]